VPLVWYDVTLTRELPIALSVQSLCNALAHVISVASTGSIVGTIRAEAWPRRHRRSAGSKSYSRLPASIAFAAL